jgi:hypothetical protein
LHCSRWGQNMKTDLSLKDPGGRESSAAHPASASPIWRNTRLPFSKPATDRMTNLGAIEMEPCGKGLWRLRRNAGNVPPSGKKWIHVGGPYYREVSSKPTLLDLLRNAVEENSLHGGAEVFTPSTRE